MQGRRVSRCGAGKINKKEKPGKEGDTRGRKNAPPIPNLNQTIAPARHEPPSSAPRPRRRGSDQTGRGHRRRPADGVGADAVRGEDLVLPAVVLELEHADAAVGRGAGEEAAALVRRPGYDVHGGGVQGEFEDFGPEPGLFAPD